MATPVIQKRSRWVAGGIQISFCGVDSRCRVKDVGRKNFDCRFGGGVSQNGGHMVGGGSEKHSKVDKIWGRGRNAGGGV